MHMKKGELAQTLEAAQRPTETWWRIMLSTILLYLVGAAALVPTGKMVVALIGLVVVMTTITGVCLIYSILGLSTLKRLRGYRWAPFDFSATEANHHDRMAEHVQQADWNLE
jgi:hypothetical protein